MTCRYCEHARILGSASASSATIHRVRAERAAARPATGTAASAEGEAPTCRADDSAGLLKQLRAESNVEKISTCVRTGRLRLGIYLRGAGTAGAARAQYSDALRPRRARAPGPRG